MPSPSPHRFATLLRQQRHAQGLTQTDLAERAQVSRRAIVDLERDASQPHPTTLLRLAEALCLPPAQREHFLAAANQAKRTSRRNV
jgi:transcriptional regulator with XRE-family HTH domain